MQNNIVVGFCGIGQPVCGACVDHVHVGCLAGILTGAAFGLPPRGVAQRDALASQLTERVQELSATAAELRKKASAASARAEREAAGRAEAAAELRALRARLAAEHASPPRAPRDGARRAEVEELAERAEAAREAAAAAEERRAAAEREAAALRESAAEDGAAAGLRARQAEEEAKVGKGLAAKLQSAGGWGPWHVWHELRAPTRL